MVLLGPQLRAKKNRASWEDERGFDSDTEPELEREVENQGHAANEGDGEGEVDGEDEGDAEDEMIL
ncbi:hypothetical protein Daus18300_012619 [Diaporthe australafricana]|uniref:Uncharacterized protein n=1 Tax=Diaporthe australafricana TaxID=127596 RepID=A0ABR3W201_9PEZI